MNVEKQELCYYIVMNLMVSIVTFITACCFASMIKPFLSKKKCRWLPGLVYFVVMEILYYIPVHIENFFAYGLGILASFLVMVVIDRKNLCQKIFLCITFFSLRWLSLAMENVLEQVFYYESMKLPGYMKNWELQFKIFIVNNFFTIILTTIFLNVPVWLIRKAYVYKKEIVTVREMLILSMPSLSSMLAYQLLHYYAAIYQRDAGKSVYDIYGAYNWLCFFYYAFSFVTILVVVILFQNMKGRQIDKQQHILFKTNMLDMEKHIREVEKLYQDIRSLKHDMGNHLMTLEGLYQREEHEEAQKYAAQLRENLLNTGLKIKSGNPVTDVILIEKDKEAERKGILFTSEFHYPEKLQIDVFDISIILNNALANSIEAAEGCENSYISVLSYQRRNVCMIIVENSGKSQPVMDEESGLPVTDKEDQDGHGFGLINMRRVAQKYYGDIDISCDGNSFVLHVMLMGNVLQQEMGD